MIIVNYNGMKWLPMCLSSIVETDYPKDKYEVIVVDNASSDGSADYIGAIFPQVKLIRMQTNVGYALGANVGFNSSKGEFIAVLNNDVRVTKDWLVKLVRVMQSNPKIGAVCPKKLLMSSPKTLDGAGGCLNVIGQGWDRGEGEVDQGQFSRVDEITHPSGAAFLTKRSAILRLRYLLNPDFFLLYDDAEFGLRCWLCGFRVLYVPSSVIYHARSPVLGSFLSTSNMYYFSRNLFATFFEIFDFSVLLFLFPLLIFSRMTQAFYLLLFHKKWKAMLSLLRGLKDFLLNLKRHNGRRILIRSEKKASAVDLLSRFTPTITVLPSALNHRTLLRMFIEAVNISTIFTNRLKPVKFIRVVRGDLSEAYESA